MRGRALQLGEAVTLTAPQEDELIRADVDPGEAEQGDDVVHHVALRCDGDSVMGECTCETFTGGVYCDHIWATLLYIQDSEDTVDQRLPRLRKELEQRRVRPPRARKRARTASRQKQAEWISRLSQLRPPTTELQTVDLGFEEQVEAIWYVILAELSGRYNALFIELREGPPSLALLSDGRVPTGSLKSIRLGSNMLCQLGQPEDRDICSSIVGSVGIVDPQADRIASADRGHTVYRLAPGTRRQQLCRMIQSGRCLVDQQDGSARSLRPVHHWHDQAMWQLWMVGEMEGRDLMLHLELRRDDRRMGIHQPLLIVGGEDGFLLTRAGEAEPLDDGGAYRWISQFRAESSGDAEPKPMKVPSRDIGRFIERLYRLPFLPHIELPGQYAVEEQQLEPVPCLEVAGSAGAQDSEPVSVQANQALQAWFWMEYGEERVNPATPGRYVTLASAIEEAGDDAADESTVEQTATSAGDAQAGESTSSPAQGRLILRQPQCEREAAQTLTQMGMTRMANAGGNSFSLAAGRLASVVSRLSKLGWRITANQQVVVRAGTPAVSVSSGIDWFEMTGSVSYERSDGVMQQVPLPAILDAIRGGRHMIELDDGSQGLLPEQWLADQGLLNAVAQVEGDQVRFKRNHVALLDALLEQTEVISVDETFAQLRDRLRSFQGVEPVAAGERFVGELRQYQQEGLGWLEFLQWLGMGGILADDMGLGKTIQVLAMLDRYLAEAGQQRKPTLVVAPKSVVFNWLDEAERFVPHMKILSYAGPERHNDRDTFADQDLIITSYGLMRRDIEHLIEQEFAYIILDEAQAIKNPTSQSAKAANIIKADNRLALTGTPIENHLGDLWSIFEFLNPGILGSHMRFNELVRAGNVSRNGKNTGEAITDDQPVKTIGRPSGEHQAVSADASSSISSMGSLTQLSRMLRPFILRRTKKQVLSDLPEKTEQTLLCDMEPAQQQVYDELREYYRKSLMNKIDKSTSKKGIGSASFMVLEALLRLRQAACHPGLIDPARSDEPSAKLEALFEMLGEVMEEGGKALVFSQFTSMLAIVRRHLDERGIRYVYLDGQTRNRREVVDQFQNDPDIPLFLISLKAGGFGLNLTAAEYVFILDPWWNPAVESQAIDRAHRIGQTRPVFAYRLVCRDTVEQRILSLQAKKRELADAIVDGEQTPLRDLTRDDLDQLLS